MPTIPPELERPPIPPLAQTLLEAVAGACSEIGPELLTAFEGSQRLTFAELCHYINQRVQDGTLRVPDPESAWLNDNAIRVAGGTVIFALAIFGWNQYQSRYQRGGQPYPNTRVLRPILRRILRQATFRIQSSRVHRFQHRLRRRFHLRRRFSILRCFRRVRVQTARFQHSTETTTTRGRHLQPVPLPTTWLPPSPPPPASSPHHLSRRLSNGHFSPQPPPPRRVATHRRSSSAPARACYYGVSQPGFAGRLNGS